MVPGEFSQPGPAASVFGAAGDWFLFEASGGRPDLLDFAHVARGLRERLMACGSQPVPEILSGRRATGRASRRPYVAVVPLADVGFARATGDLWGFAVVPPRGLGFGERAEVLRAITVVAGLDRAGEAGFAFDAGGAGRLHVRHVGGLPRSALRPERWCALKRCWASAMPVLLEREAGAGDAGCPMPLVARACRRIGLPEPREIDIREQSVITGAPPADPPGDDGRSGGWSFPRGSRLAGRPRCHVVLRFADEVEGPVLLGAGRFHGFGLCLPVDAEAAVALPSVAA